MIATELSHIQLAMYNGVHEVSVLGQLSHLLCDIASHVLLQVAKPTFDQLANFQSEENFCVMRVSKNQQMNTGGLVRACVIGSFSENASNFKNEKKNEKINIRSNGFITRPYMYYDGCYATSHRT